MSEKGTSVFLILNLFTFFKKDKIMVQKYQHFMLSGNFRQIYQTLILQINHVMFHSSSMWSFSCKNNLIGAGNLQLITYKFWCACLDSVTGQIAAWFYLNSSEISYSLKFSKASAKASFMYQQWTTTVYVFKGSNYGFFCLLFKTFQEQLFFVINISNYLWIEY